MAISSTIVCALIAFSALTFGPALTGQTMSRLHSTGMLAADADGAPAAVDSLPGMHVRANTLYLSCPSNAVRSVPLAIYNNDQVRIHAGQVDVPDVDATWLSVENGKFLALGTALDIETYQVATVHVDGSRLPMGRTDATILVRSDDSLHPAIPVHLIVVVRDGLPEQPANCVVEESTGTWCSGCPEGARMLEKMKERFGERSIILSYHDFDDLSVPEGAATITQELGINAYPIVALMRRRDPQNGRLDIWGDWESRVAAELGRRPFGGAAVTAAEYSFDKTSHTVKATLHITSNDPVPLPADIVVAMTAIVVEDDIDTWQIEHMDDGSIVRHDHYLQRNVVRAIWPNRFGRVVPFDAATVQNGILMPRSEATMVIEFAAPNYIDPGRSRIIFLIHQVDTADRASTQRQHLGEILQGIELPLLTSITASTPRNEEADESSFTGELLPTPTQGEARIPIHLGHPDEVDIQVIDGRGELVRHIRLGKLEAGTYAPTIAVDGLANGIYSVIVRTTDHSVVRKLILSR